jgi:multiple antibiotic resistance protein
MKDFTKYFVLGFSALLPLINPPGHALELLSIVGVVETKVYKVLARKIAINTILFLTAVALIGPYALQFFGISIEVMQLVGGGVLAAMGWRLLNDSSDRHGAATNPNVKRAEDCAARYWQTRAFYPLTFPMTVGPGSLAVTLTLSAQAGNLQFSERIPAFLGLFVCGAALSILTYVFCASAPLAAAKLPSTLIYDVLRIVAFLLICIGTQIAWHGIHGLLSAGH